MRLSGTWAWAGLATALGLGCASVPWTLDTEWLRARLDDYASIQGFHWEKPARATLRLFPTPVLDVYSLKLVDGAGKVAFEASAAAFALSMPNLAVGRYVFVRARLKDPKAEIDLDALAPLLPELLKSPPVQRVQARGGRLRLVSRRLGLSEDLSPVDGSFVWSGENQPLQATFGGVWRGQWADVDAALDMPAEFLAGRPSDILFNLTAAGLTARMQGKAQIGGKPGFAGTVVASALSLSAAAEWLGLDASLLADEKAEISGRVTASPEMLSLDDGSLGYKNEKFEGTAGLLKGPTGWSATATLAAEQLDLNNLIGPPPEIFGALGGWSQMPGRLNVPSLDLDLRLSAANLIWGGVSFVDTALALQRQADKATLKIIEAGFAGGGLNGEIEIAHCTTACQAKASLTLANADLGAISRLAGLKSLSGRVSGVLEIAGLGETPAALVTTAHGELQVEALDGAIHGLNFEEALRRGQRRSLDLARDLVVGKTAFHEISAKLSIADGRADIESARLGGPGVSVDGSGRIELAKCALATTIEARQADAQGKASPDGAVLSLELNGPWRSPRLIQKAGDD